jgi:uncharacterized pyridoxamine 5'-phosphate oxidase family protein
MEKKKKTTTPAIKEGRLSLQGRKVNQQTSYQIISNSVKHIKQGNDNICTFCVFKDGNFLRVSGNIIFFQNPILNKN